MVLSTCVSLFTHGMHNYALILLAIIIGAYVAYRYGKSVQMTNMPQMIAIYNGMGGGAAATIAMNEMLKTSTLSCFGIHSFGLLGALIGTISFSGSIIAFLKLQDIMKKNINIPKHQLINIGLLCISIIFGILFFSSGSIFSLFIFFAFAFVYGISATIPIGGADMPVVIALYNAFTGLAVALEGFVLRNVAVIIAGTVVGASGTLLTMLMAKAMNRSIFSVMFSKFGEVSSGGQSTGIMRSLEIEDVASMLEYVGKVVFIPGYGMAVAQAQQKVWELASILIEKGVDVRFAIHPVAGRMPGHMNVLLAEAGVPYDLIYDIDDINDDFPNVDISIVLGANDVVNPVAKTDKGSPIYGMPILDAYLSKNIFVIKRGKGAGYSGIENTLFFDDKTRMVYGDAKSVISKIIQAIKSSS